MKSDALEMSMLFDFFSQVLTDKQREYFDCYYNQDLSLGEIAENEGITRQGVRDVIVRAENTMRTLEEQTGLLARYRRVQSAAAVIESAAEKIKRLNYGVSKEIDTQLSEIRQAVEAIKE